MKKNITFIIIILNIIQILNIIVFPFQIKSKSKKNINDENEYYIYTNFEMGDPPQKINCEINFDINDYFITYSPLNVQPSYNDSLSKSFVKSSTNRITSSHFSGGFWGLENFYFYTDLECKNKQKFESLNAVFPPKENKLSACEIGLQPSHIFGKYQSIIHILKSKQIVSNYIWTLKFKNLNEGILAIGSAPHEYNKINYKENELIYTNGFSDNDKLYWCLYFKYSTINNNTMSQNIKMKISPNIIGLIATYDYLTSIEMIFFKKYYDKNICEKEIISFDNNSYFKILCHKELFNSKDIEQFPPLYLYNIAFNYSFILNGKELFIENNNDRIDFQILIEIDSTNTEWKLGRIFLSKYQIIFDDDNGVIGFYSSLPKVEVNNNKTRNLFLKIFILSLALIVFLFLFFLLYKKINILTKRKKLANELEDNFMYIPRKNNGK